MLFDLAAHPPGRARPGERGAAREPAPSCMGVGELVTLGRARSACSRRAPRAAPAVDPQLKAQIDSLVWLRQEARKQRDFAEADRLRDELDPAGRGPRGHARRDDLEARSLSRAGRRRRSSGATRCSSCSAPPARSVEEIAILAEGRGPALQELLTLARSRGVKVSYRTRDQLTAMAGDRPPPGRGGAGGRGELRHRWTTSSPYRPAPQEPALLPGPRPGPGPAEPGGGAPDRRGDGGARGGAPQASRRGPHPRRRQVRPWGRRSTSRWRARPTWSNVLEILKKESIWVMGAAAQGGTRSLGRWT